MAPVVFFLPRLQREVQRPSSVVVVHKKNRDIFPGRKNVSGATAQQWRKPRNLGRKPRNLAQPNLAWAETWVGHQYTNIRPEPDKSW
jgi:hypothetical protein